MRKKKGAIAHKKTCIIFDTRLKDETKEKIQHNEAKAISSRKFRSSGEYGQNTNRMI